MESYSARDPAMSSCSKRTPARCNLAIGASSPPFSEINASSEARMLASSWLSAAIKASPRAEAAFAFADF